DYKNAVQAGKVVNPDEYQEMLEFSTRSVELFKQLKASEGRDTAGIEKDLHSLASHIKRRSNHDLVSGLAQQIKARLIAAYRIVTYPKSLPHLQAGRNVYARNCAQCHGDTGRGDGPSAATMQPKEPKPANFTDRDLMQGLSPFKAFNTTSFGIEGTAMANFSALSEEERWQAAFYVFSLRFSPEQSAAGKKLHQTRASEQIKAPELLATFSDEELSDKIRALFPEAQDAENVVAYLRRGLLEESVADPLLIARTYLKDTVDLYRQGKRSEAYQKSVDAYLDGFELAEPALFTKDASFGRTLEGKFTEFRGAIRRGDDVSKVLALYNELDQGLARALEVLSRQEPGGGSYTLFNAALIILREGIEAALIVSAIVAVLKATGAARAIFYVHLGWILALVSGVLTWILAQTVLTVSGAQREIMEGFTALLAAVVLFSVSYWLISKADAKKWQNYIRNKVQEALTGGRIAALVGVSFLAVYREAFETVLFYQALWLQSEAARNAVIWGFLLGAALLAVVVWIIFRLGLKVPLRLFFGISSALLYLLAFVFAGEGIKDLQAAGWFSETPLE
ncbi:MAG: FTR1 family protein, partial [Candidatus Binatia bacterium]